MGKSRKTIAMDAQARQDWKEDKHVRLTNASITKVACKAEFLCASKKVLEKFKKFEAAKKKMEEAKSEWMESIGDRIDAHAEWGNACEQHASIKSERMPR
ncbi:unnamed protein product [Prorocentrum cordatum]|uniref:Remorin C-terminal domain-containing protein n=1 Tax=Prorocentrum cordatum TaxID=2364126 RepID=A0ABN9VSZ1_9DINO|nr:unnamed protein product [Polarella glacialis]